MSVRASLAFILAGALIGCAGPEVTVDCALGDQCDEIVAAATRVVPRARSHWVVKIGRGRGFHAEVHVCYASGEFLLVDVMGDPMGASIREAPGEDPICP